MTLQQGTFISVEVDDSASSDPELAKRLEEACPVDIFAASETGVSLVKHNIDECVLCGLCLDAAPDGAVQVRRLYADGALLER